MATNDQGALSVSINGTAEQNAVELKSGDIASITLSLVPANGAIELLWFMNGRLSLIDSLAVNPTVSSPVGTSTIAGAGGFTGLIDEFGVYYRDSAGKSTTDPEVYRRSMTDEYGSNLVFAEGFDGINLPSDLILDSQIVRSQLIDGSLSLNPNQSVELPNLPIGEDDLTIDVALSGLSDTGSGTLTLSLKGKTLYSVALKDALSSTGDVAIHLSRVDGGIKITPGKQISTTINGEFSNIDVGLSSSGTTPISLRSFLVIKTRAQLANKSSTSTQPPTPET
jgi:hypothetical protein